MKRRRRKRGRRGRRRKRRDGSSMLKQQPTNGVCGADENLPCTNMGMLGGRRKEVLQFRFSSVTILGLRQSDADVNRGGTLKPASRMQLIIRRRRTWTHSPSPSVPSYVSVTQSRNGEYKIY